LRRFEQIPRGHEVETLPVRDGERRVDRDAVEGAYRESWQDGVPHFGEQVAADPHAIGVQRTIVFIDIGIAAGDGDGSGQRALGGKGEPVAARALEALVELDAHDVDRRPRFRGDAYG